MHSLLESALKGLVSGTVGAGIKAATSSKSEKKLPLRVISEVKELNRKVERDKNEIKSELHKNAKKELLTGVSYYNEGLAFLSEGLDSIKTSNQENIPLETRLDVQEKANMEVVLQSFTAVLQEAVSLIKWQDLDESIIRCFSNSKKRFQDARKKVTKAFNNEVLVPEERIMAIRYRVLATILESIDHPQDAIPACKTCLEELHSLPFVETSFENFQDQIHDLNRIICELTGSFGRRGALLSWPCVDVKGKKIDPRIVFCGTTSWSFGQEGEGTQKLLHAWDVTSNSLGEFIVADSEDHSVKVFDSRGKFLHRLTPFTDEPISESQDEMISEIWSVATDKNDNIYILGQEKNTSEYSSAVSKVFVYSKSNNFVYKFSLLDGFRGSSMTINSNNLVFITGGEFTKFHKNILVEVYENEGKFVQSFGKGIIEHAFGICAADNGQVFVLDRGAGVLVFSNGEPLHQFQVISANFGAIAFHPVSQNVFVASLLKTCPTIMVYSKDGKRERLIKFDKQGVPIITGMSVTSQGRIAITAKDLVLFS